MTIIPADAASCAAALAEAAGAGRTMRVRGGGTKDYLGDVRDTDVELRTTALAGVVDHVPADLTVTLRAGTRLADAQRVLGEAGQFLPLDPPHVAQGATIGGVIASSSNGFARVRYGGVRDLLIGTAIALADGTVARTGGRVVKNVAGYDLNKLLAGSLGTLGVIVEATFKVLPLPARREAAIVRCAGAADAYARADRLVRSSLRPSALAVEITRDGVTLAVAAEGTDAEVGRAMHDAGGERGADVDAVLAPLRELPATATDGALVRVAVPLAAQRAFAETALGLEGFARLVADAGTGVARVHLRGDDASVIASADELLAAARIVGGSARVERRSATVAGRLSGWAAEPGGLFLMRRLKDAFDPAGILEPGRSIVG